MTPTGIAATALVAHLRGSIAASVATVNSYRLNKVAALTSEPYVFGSGDWFIGVGQSIDPTDFCAYWQVAPGTYTAAQLASHLDGQPPVYEPGTAPSTYPVFGSEGGRFTVSYVQTVSALVVLGELDPALTNLLNVATVLGIGTDGLISDVAPIVAPTREGICDGFPLTAPDMGQGFWVIIGDREATPTEGTSLRRDTWDVRLLLHIARPSHPNERHRTREPIAACLDAVSACLLTTAGRQLGRAAIGDVQMAEIVAERVGGAAIQFEEIQNVLFDTASLDVVVRVFQRPASS